MQNITLDHLQGMMGPVAMPIPEAQVEEMRRLREAYERPTSYKPGQVVRFQRSSLFAVDENQPLLVVELQEASEHTPPVFDGGVEVSSPTAGWRPEVRVLRAFRTSEGIAYGMQWLESWMLEPWVASEASHEPEYGTDAEEGPTDDVARPKPEVGRNSPPWVSKAPSMIG